MANCGNCKHRTREEIGHTCALSQIPVSLNSWCEQHDAKPAAGEPKSQRFTDNPRSSEDIHD